MTVAFDAQGTALVTANGVTSITFTNLTIGTGSNRALIVQLVFSNKSLTGLSVVWDSGGTNQALTQIISAQSSTTGMVQLWGLVSPTSGNKTLKVSWTGSSDVVVDAISYSGVDQTGGVTTFYNATTTNGNSGSTSITVNSAVGDAAVEALVTQASISLSSGNQTIVFATNAPANMSGAGQRAAGAASVTFTWTLLNALVWTEVACSIKAAGSALTVNLVGQQNSSGQGALTSFVQVLLPGQGNSSGIGGLIANPSVAMSGQQTASAQGSLLEILQAVLQGQVGLSGQGTFAFGTIFALLGQAISGQIGVLSTDALANLSGIQASSGEGSLIANLVTSPPGQSVHGSVGNLSIIEKANLTGQSITSAHGAIVSEAIIQIIGLQDAAQQGIVTPTIISGPVTINILGQSITGDIGTLVAAISSQLSGQSTTSELGGLLGDIVVSLLGQHNCSFQGEIYSSSSSITKDWNAIAGPINAWTPLGKPSSTWSKPSPPANSWTSINIPSNSWTKKGDQC